MKFLSSLIVITLVIVGVFALIPVISVAIGLLIAGFFLFIWLVPFWIIATSDKTTGLEKLVWILLMLCFSWFAWIIYFFIAPVKQKERHYYDSARY